jgi:alginate O-acetyltransferase complex protein AlgI
LSRYDTDAFALMPLNSPEFLLAFLPLTVLGYWLLSRLQCRLWAVGWLVLASTLFYARASLMSLALLAPSILFDYGIAQCLLRTAPSKQRVRRLLFISGVTANVLFLGYFKYRSMFLDTTNELFGTHFDTIRLLLPLGISFLVLQKIAFLADVQSGQVRAAPLLEYLLFTLFFPRTIAGPIIHYEEVAPQLRQRPNDGALTHISVGLCLLSIGLFKKAVIADNLAQFVTPVFDVSRALDPLAGPPALLESWLALLCYTFQLYFDFSGYSDMALGAARMLGVTLPMNFNSPFKASSIVEYWSRWHITLTRFLTTYVYTPIVLHGTRKRMIAGAPVLEGEHTRLSAIVVLIAFPTLATMAISGLWHGAAWQFVLWGILHGLSLTINQGWRLLRPRFWPDEYSYDRVMKPVGRVLTFGFVMLALVLFRAPSVSTAASILEGLLGLHGVFPEAIRLLHAAGTEAPWPLMEGMLHIAAFCWILVLFPFVMYLPNSLELLRRFHPALHFRPPNAAKSSRATASSTLPVHQEEAPLGPARPVRLAWARWRTIEGGGVTLSPLVAIATAILGVLGLMALDRGSGFLYGQF